MNFWIDRSRKNNKEYRMTGPKIKPPIAHKQLLLMPKADAVSETPNRFLTFSDNRCYCLLFQISRTSFHETHTPLQPLLNIRVKYYLLFYASWLWLRHGIYVRTFHIALLFLVVNRINDVGERRNNTIFHNRFSFPVNLFKPKFLEDNFLILNLLIL